jgi:hypothetical protein
MSVWVKAKPQTQLRVVLEVHWVCASFEPTYFAWMPAFARSPA